MLLIQVSTGANAKCYPICRGIRTKKQKENKVAGIVLVTK